MSVKLHSGDTIILAGDIGGTNTNLAAVIKHGGAFSITAKSSRDSKSVTDFVQVVKEVLAEFDLPAPPRYCCISAAGIVEQNRCQPTNLSWVIDGDKLQQDMGIPTVIINDFMALSYSLPLLDVNNPKEILPLPHPDGSVPEPRGGIYAIIGAGTGLGVGVLSRVEGRYVAFPSEGGHTDFPAFDRETQRLGNFLKTRYDSWPGTECVLSGRGIANIYAYVRDTMAGPGDDILQEIDSLPETERPALISLHGCTNPVCSRVMELFTRIYGKFAGNTALNFLPEAGLFLAGGIAQKNIDFLLHEQRFMRYFESNYNLKMRTLQQRVPVFLIKEYSVSLLGAAHAATLLLD
ncbi:glucokinase [Marispirochaeta sp.]|uniref:glucokinase n=1 Tax=Marispirochaeta sp. TaxID=2038653 RepID=UPI0029C8CCF8|nr:glucokinase [Marispirochaeta sp.]